MNSYELLVSILFQNHAGIKTIQLFQTYIFYNAHALCCIFKQEVQNSDSCNSQLTKHHLNIFQGEITMCYINDGARIAFSLSALASSIRTHHWELYTLLLFTINLRALLNEVHINTLSFSIWGTELPLLFQQEIENFKNNWKKNTLRWVKCCSKLTAVNGPVPENLVTSKQITFCSITAIGQEPWRESGFYQFNGTLYIFVSCTAISFLHSCRTLEWRLLFFGSFVSA